MTVRVTTLKHAGAGRYYTEHLPSYYLDGDEPPGRWWGQGANRLGLSGNIEAEGFLAVMAGRDPDTGRDLGRRFGEGSVRGFDATFSAPKSVSVLFGVGNPELRRRVTEAHDRAVDAVLGWVEAQAHTRMRRRGHVVCVDAEGILVGVFRQHTSRRLDPQLHTHAVIVNRVRSPDGRWLALDARTLKMDQRTLSALYHATLRTELTRRLGVSWQQPEHGIAEIEGIDAAVLAGFSQRTREVERRCDAKLERFRRNLGREPTPQERWRLEREAAVDSRPNKNHPHAAGELHREWRSRLRTLGHEPQDLVAGVLDRQRQSLGISPQMAAGMVERALEALTARQSTWRPAELVRELATQVPTTVTVDPGDLTGFLQRLADETAATRCVDLSPPVPSHAQLRRDGRPVTEAATDRALTTRHILDEEEHLLEWARTRRALPDTLPTRQHDTVGDRRLSAGQAEACAAVSGLNPLELIVGPAGTGKTTALAPAVAELQGEGRVVFGVTPTAAAADVLATETTMATDTLDKLLTEHRHPNRPPHQFYDLPRGSTVIVDEAATVSTPKLAELARLADRYRWRVVLVGDPRQFSAVGRGGMFAHLVDTYGAIELDQVHRFTDPWEADASLRLRSGDPTVLADYNTQGRLHGGSQDQMETGIIDAWSQARQRGETVALMANRTDTVNRLNQYAQATRIRNRELDPTEPHRDIGQQRLLVGDEAVTRRNDRTLRTDRGLMIKNRDHWTVETLHTDGSVTLNGYTGTIRIPSVYVEEHLELGYAQTSHATQGRTVDTALLLIDAPTDSRGVYTPMTRGRHSNHAYVVTDENRTAVDVLTRVITRDWIDQPATALRNQLETRHLDPPRWPSIEKQYKASETGHITETGREPTHTERGDTERSSADEQRLQQIFEDALAVIERRRRSVTRDPGRDHLTLGR